MVSRSVGGLWWYLVGNVIGILACVEMIFFVGLARVR